MFAFGVRFSRVSMSGALLLLGAAPLLANAACAPNDCLTTALDNLQLTNGGDFNVGTGGRLTNSTVSDGKLHLWDAGVAFGTTLKDAGWLQVHDNGQAYDTVVQNGQMVLTESGTALRTTINGGFLDVVHNATVSDTLLNGGGMYVYYDALAKNTTVNNSQMNVFQNGNAHRSTVNDGGTLSVSDTAKVSDTVVNQGGVMESVAGTSVRSTKVNQGGLMVLGNQAEAADTTINRNGNLLLKGFATLSGPTHVDGQVRFADPAMRGFHTLTIDGPLSGNGTFWMNTDLASLQGDLLKVQGLVSDSHTLVVADSGNAPGRAQQKLMLVDSNGGSGDFKLYGETVDAGAYRYQLQQQGNDWYLASLAVVDPDSRPDPPTPNPEPTPDPAPNPGPDPQIPDIVTEPTAPDVAPPTVSPPPTQPPHLPQVQILSKGANAAVASPAASAALISAQMNATTGHLSDLRSGKALGGLWIRSYGAEQHLDTGTSRVFEQQVGGMEIGADKALPFADGTLYVGGLVGKGQGRQQFGEASKGTIDSATLGGYAGYLDRSGLYVDGALKYSLLENEIDITSNLGDKVKARYKNHAVSANVQVGKSVDLGQGWFVEPQAGMQVVRISGARYTSSNGLNVEQDSMLSVQSHVGGVFGRNLQLDNGIAVKPYAKTAWFTEHAGNSQVKVNGSRLNSRLPGSRAEIGGGIVMTAADKHAVYVEGQYAKGSDIEQPWAVNLGYRYRW